MSLVSRSSQADIDTTSAIQAGNKIPRLPGTSLMAGEDLDACAPCRIDADGNIYMSDATADDASAAVIGFTPRAYRQGQAVTLFRDNTVLNYADDFAAEGIAPGSTLYIGAEAGRLDSAATTGDSEGVAQVLDAQRILITRAA